MSQHAFAAEWGRSGEEGVWMFPRLSVDRSEHAPASAVGSGQRGGEYSGTGELLVEAYRVSPPAGFQLELQTGQEPLLGTRRSFLSFVNQGYSLLFTSRLLWSSRFSPLRLLP
ncbi:hypothetical protein NQZ68_014098 [Dissostichus eleginoides]|nr:hypothetical protein NQZ68_014098 [Dissostichus eleginoides]